MPIRHRFLEVAVKEFDFFGDTGAENMIGADQCAALIQLQGAFFLLPVDFRFHAPGFQGADCREKDGQLQTVFTAVVKKAGGSVDAQSQSTSSGAGFDLAEQPEKAQIFAEPAQFGRFGGIDQQIEVFGTQQQCLHLTEIVTFEQLPRIQILERDQAVIFRKIGIKTALPSRGLPSPAACLRA